MRGERSEEARRGAVALELGAALVATVLLGVTAFDLCFPLFMQATLNHAARAGVDAAMERPRPNEEVEAAVRESALGLLGEEANVDVVYQNPLGAGTTGPTAGGLVSVRISGVPAARVLGGWWGAPLTLAARAADQLP